MEVDGIENDAELQELVLEAVQITAHPSVGGTAREGFYDLFGSMKKVLIRATEESQQGLDAPMIGALRTACKDGDQDPRSDEETRPSTDGPTGDGDTLPRYVVPTTLVTFSLFNSPWKPVTIFITRCLSW